VSAVELTAAAVFTRENLVELTVAAVFALAGIRSIAHWLRQPLHLVGRGELVVFALFVVARAGLWFGLSGLFLLFASFDTEGRAFMDDAAAFRWYFVVFLVLIALHFATSVLLGRARRDPPADGDRNA
jgi:hypothetical protein